MKNVMLDDRGKLTRLVLGAGLTKMEIARALDVSFNTVYRWMSRGVRPHPGQSKRLDKLFRENIDMLPVVEVHIKKDKNDFLQILRKDTKVKDRFILSQICNLNDIEGMDLTIKDIKRVLAGENAKTKELSQVLGIVNLKNALLYIIDTVNPKFRITEDYLQKLFSIVMYNSNDNLSENVPIKIKSLIKDLNVYGKQLINKVSKDHCKVRSIKPYFEDNGRIGRLIMLTQLLSKGYPPVIIRIQDKDKYHQALSKADSEAMAQVICDAIQNGLNSFYG